MNKKKWAAVSYERSDLVPKHNAKMRDIVKQVNMQ